MGRNAIVLEGVSKSFRFYAHPRHRLFELLGRGRRRFHEENRALQGIDLEIEQGATVALIGLNGSGKSTLLQVMAGILAPTTGSVRVEGRVATLLDLGAGFHPDFTGRENVLMCGDVLGLPAEEMRRLLPSIEAFAEIGAFLDKPVRTYSAGMFVRLAFATAIHADPDVLLVDEVLAVGDMVFQHRCIRRVRELQEMGKTIVIATHDVGAVESLCREAVLMSGGRIEFRGRPADAVERYRALCYEIEARSSVPSASPARPPRAAAAPSADLEPAPAPPAGAHRFGTGRATIVGFDVAGEGGDVATARAGERLAVRITVEYREAVANPIVGFTLTDRMGLPVVVSNTFLEGRHLPAAVPGDLHTVELAFVLPALLPGSYAISPAVADGEQRDHAMLDWVDQALVFEVARGREQLGLVGVPVAVRHVVHQGAGKWY
jgi:lipopolysaccharide transport system ATP-binding protein